METFTHIQYRLWLWTENVMVIKWALYVNINIANVQKNVSTT